MGTVQAVCSPQSPCPLPTEVGKINIENAAYALTTTEMQSYTWPHPKFTDPRLDLHR